MATPPFCHSNTRMRVATHCEYDIGFYASNYYSLENFLTETVLGDAFI